MLLSGKNLQLVPYVPQYWESVAQWFYSDKYRGMFRQYAQAMQKSDFEQYPKVVGGEVFIILHKQTNEVVGMTQIIADTKSNRAFFAGLLIDEKCQKNRYPLETFIILFDYAFNRRGYRKAIVEVLASNLGLKKTIEEGGFIKEGDLVGDAFIDGQFVNETRYAMFSNYYNKTYKEVKQLWAES